MLHHAGKRRVKRRDLTLAWLPSELGGLALTDQSDKDAGQEAALLALFVRNQTKVALVLPVMAALFALSNLVWARWDAAVIWLACALGAQGVQLSLCRYYESADNRLVRPGEWVGMLAASELLFASS